MSHAIEMAMRNRVAQSQILNAPAQRRGFAGNTWWDVGHQYAPYANYVFHPYPNGAGPSGMGDFLDDRRSRLVVGLLAAGAVVAVALVVFGGNKGRRRRRA